MIPKQNLNTLLDDVLNDERLESLKTSLHTACRRELAHKRRPWLRWMLPVAAAAILLVALQLFRSTELTGDRGGEVVQTATPSFYVAQTIPLTEAQRVSTSPQITDRYRAKTLTQAVVVRTERTGSIDLLNDDEMLALFAGVSCGLIEKRQLHEKGQAQKTLVFLNPEDQARFMPDLGG